MKIKIIAPIPVATNNKPVVGKTYEVKSVTHGRSTLYFITINGEDIGVWQHECEVIN